MKILIVDDDSIARMALADLLTSFDIYSIEEADDGDVAWDMMTTGLPPVLICCDVRMPKLSGIELLRRVRTHPTLKDIPFVMISSAADTNTIHRAVNHGAQGYILKPFEPEDARLRLEKIFKYAHSKMAESPLNVTQRLQVSLDKYRTYLNSFYKQLATHLSGLNEIPNEAELQALRLQLETYHKGCTTLGLWHVTLILQVMGSDTLRPEEFIKGIEEIKTLIDWQLQVCDGLMPPEFA